jgi:hypothetical protein
VERGSFRREVRSFFLALIAGVLVLILSITAGTRDPLALLLRVLIALMVAWLLFEFLQAIAPRVWQRKNAWSKSKGIAPTEPSPGKAPGLAISVSYAPRTPLPKRELVYHTQGRRDYEVPVPQAPSPHTLHFHTPADAIVRKGDTPQILSWGTKSRIVVKGFTPAGFVVDEVNTVGEEVRVEVYYANGSVATDPLKPQTTAVSTDPTNALVVTWQGEQWSNFQYKAWIFRLRMRVENRTDQPIRLMNMTFQGPPMAETTPEIYAERERIKRELGAPPNPVPPHDAIEMWYVGEFRFDPDLGEPDYEIRVKASNGGHEYGFRRAGNPKREIKP